MTPGTNSGMESLTLRQNPSLHNARVRADTRRGRSELSPYEMSVQGSSNGFRSTEVHQPPRLAPILDSQRAMSETRPSTLPIHSASLMNSTLRHAQPTPQSSPHPADDHHTGIVLPPIREIMPFFSPPKTPDRLKGSLLPEESVTYGLNGKPASIRNKRLKLETLVEPVAHRQSSYESGGRERTYSSGSAVNAIDGELTRSRYVGRSPSEYSYTSAGFGSTSSDSSNGQASSFRRPAVGHVSEPGRGPIYTTPYTSPRLGTSLPPISSLSTGHHSTNRPDYASHGKLKDHHEGYGTVNGVSPDAERIDRAWNRRTSSVAYPYHDHGEACHCNHIHGHEAYRENSCYTWDIPSAPDGQFHRKRRGNLPKDATAMFKKWYDEHRDSPYPSEEEKMRFCRETGLTMNQVGNWFINARRRQPNRGPRESSSIEVKDEV